jgi:GT2 family glycosyltransferase
VNEDYFVTEQGQVEQGKIGVVTITYNSQQVLLEFFDSVAGQTHSNYVLYVVDNASSDRTLEVTRLHSDLPISIIANTTNFGVAEGNNQGIRAALADGCECVLFLNNDTVFPVDLFAQLYDGLDRHNCDMTTCKMYYHDQPDVFWCAGGRFQPWLGYRSQHDGIDQKDNGQYDQPRRVTYTPTCCLLTRRSVFDQVGFMDGRYFVYGDDNDFLYRCLKQGLELCYLPDAKLWHKVNSLTGSTSDFTVHYCTRNRIFFMKKNLPLWQAWLGYWAYRAYFLLVFLIHRNTRKQYKFRVASAKEGWERMPTRES